MFAEAVDRRNASKLAAVISGTCLAAADSDVEQLFQPANDCQLAARPRTSSFPIRFSSAARAMHYRHAFIYWYPPSILASGGSDLGIGKWEAANHGIIAPSFEKGCHRSAKALDLEILFTLSLAQPPAWIRLLGCLKLTTVAEKSLWGINADAGSWLSFHLEDSK